MIVYRLTRPEYANDLSGFGASIAGGRWNHPGEFVLYTAQTASLSILEVLVHLNGAVLGVRYNLLTLEVDESIIQRISQIPKPSDGEDGISLAREIGSRWLSDQKYPVLEVPSVLNPLEKNLLINPLHPATNIRKLSMDWYFFDGRLVHN